MARERARRLLQVGSNTLTQGVVFRDVTAVDVLDDDGQERTVMVEGRLAGGGGSQVDAAAILPLIPRTIPVNNAPDRWDFDDYIRPAFDRWRRWSIARAEAETR